MRIFLKNKTVALLTIVFMLTIIFEYSCITVDALSDTTVTIDIESQVVGPGEEFKVNIFCIPSQPIKAFELKMLFNPSLLRATKVKMGDIFEGYFTFFNSGNINNNIGAILDIYGLILGQGTVSNPGTFVTISFTAKTTLGTSFLDITDVGVTNEAEYITIDVSDDTVSIQASGEEPPIPPEDPSGGDDDVQNLPNRPFRPSGPTKVEMGVEYTYSASTYDTDGDQVRFMFDWGDGSYSDWSDYVDSDASVFMVHSWDEASLNEILVIAQDITGLYSSWSRPLWVTVFQPSSENPPEPPSEEPDNNIPPADTGGNNPSGETRTHNSPWEPLKPSGPTYVERGVAYTYSSSAIDIDDDKVMLKFDWGDGSFSPWSELVPSSTVVSKSHTFNSSSNCEVRVMALDETLMNSSWSLPLNVTISQNNSGGKPPLANISLTSDLSVNQTIIFNASESIDSDGMIISYDWDFGDGFNSSGISVSHIYTNPGIYTVTLVIVDNNGNTYSKTILVPVVSESEEILSEKNQDAIVFDIGLILFGIVIILFVFLIFVFRDNIKSFVSSHAYNTDLFSNLRIWYTKSRINRIATSIEKTKINTYSDFNFRLKIDKILMSKKKRNLFWFFNKRVFYEPAIENVEEVVDKIFLSKVYEEIDSF